jgi:hypothetical protein
MAGAAAGLKLAMGALCIGLCAAVLASPGRPLERIHRAAFVAVAVAAGVLLTGGLWMWLMYDHFGSPLFPFLNAAFASPFAPLENFADRRFMPRDTSQALFYPFYWLSMQSLVTEPVFRDGRIAAVYVCLAVLGVQAALDRVTGTPIQDRVQARRLLVIAAFCVASYGAWLVTFSIYRYLIPLELLSGVLILATIARVAPRWPWPLALALPVCVLLSLTARAPDWGRTAWSDSYFGVDTRALERYSDATILMWDFPQGYLAPLFPRSATFVRIRTNWGMTGTDRMWERVVGTIERTPDSRLYLMDLEPGSIHEEQPAALARLGLALDDGGCERYSSHSGGFRLCPVRRIPR